MCLCPLQPLLNLTAKQMDAVLPVLTKVPTPVVAGTFKIGSVEAETMEKQLLMLRKVSRGRGGRVAGGRGHVQSHPHPFL
jgi:hypothetical protein